MEEGGKGVTRGGGEREREECQDSPLSHINSSMLDLIMTQIILNESTLLPSSVDPVVFDNDAFDGVFFLVEVP